MAFIINPQSGNKDVLQICNYPYRGGSPVTLLDMNDGVGYALISGTFNYTPAEKRQQFSDTNRRYGGSKAVGETHGNAIISAEWYISGNSADQAIQRMEALVAQVEALGDRYVAWQPSGASNPVLFKIAAGQPVELSYRWTVFQSKQTLQVKAGWQVDPLAEGLPLYISDRFAIDSHLDYTEAAGVYGTNYTITGGALVPLTANTNVKLIHTDRKYTYQDAEVVVHGRLPNAINNPLTIDGYIKYIDINNWIAVRLFRTSVPNWSIRAVVCLAGVETAAGTLTLTTAPPVAGQEFWIVGRIERSRIYTNFSFGGSPPEGPGSQGAAYVLTAGTERTTFGVGAAGSPGLGWNTPDTTLVIEDFDVRPFTYRGANTQNSENTPTTFGLAGSIPGNAPMKCDVSLVTDATNPVVFALLGWIPLPPSYNFVWNGNFEEDTDGWNTAVPPSATTFHAAGTSVTRSTSIYRWGLASGVIAVPATANSGAHFTMYRPKFRRGLTYSFEATVYADNGNAVTVGIAGSNADSATAVSAGGTSWTTVSGTWTPGADFDKAYLAIFQAAASATNIHVESVSVWEGTGKLTSVSHIQGRGALLPFGVIPAGSRDASRTTGWTSITEGTNDTNLYQNIPLATPTVAEWFIDPSLIPSDPFSDDLQLEIWMRASINGGPARVTASVLPENPTYGSQRYTAEWGSIGKVVPAMGVSGTDWRTIRLGTLSVRSDAINPVR